MSLLFVTLHCETVSSEQRKFSKHEFCFAAIIFHSVNLCVEKKDRLIENVYYFTYSIHPSTSFHSFKSYHHICLRSLAIRSLRSPGLAKLLVLSWTLSSPREDQHHQQWTLSWAPRLSPWLQLLTATPQSHLDHI